MFKMLGKKIFTIFCSIFFLNWTYEYAFKLGTKYPPEIKNNFENSTSVNNLNNLFGQNKLIYNIPILKHF